MPLKFAALCELWETLSVPNTQDKSALIQRWFKRYSHDIPCQGPSALALLSCLFPEKRPDRVYGLREKRLTRLVVDVWGVGSSRQRELERVQIEDRLDFASAVQGLVEQGGHTPELPTSLTVEEVDRTLDLVASTCDFSSSDIRNRSREPAVDAYRELKATFRRLCALELKWLIRLLLKDLRPATYPHTLTMQLFHQSLLQALEIRHDLVKALELLPDITQQQMPPHCTYATEMQTRLGTMVGLPAFDKAHSIKHCCQLAGPQKMSVERKYNGEYYQIHVRVDHCPHYEITIFSKSGRDSTKDRQSLHPTIEACLQLNISNCPVRQQCILVGEVLVWDDLTHEIMPFFKLRRYVTRAGRHLGCDQDSPPSPDEHLMIVFHDLLLLDDTCCTSEAYEDRRVRLQTLVRPISGRAEIGQQEKVNFRKPEAAASLALHFASAISQGWEGLVLKGIREPYISKAGGIQQHIKLKKDYIPGLGDSADLVVVGGQCDPKAIHTLGPGTWWWTNFFLACVENKDAFLAQNAKPRFRVVGQVSRPSISVEDIRLLNQWGRLYHLPWSHHQSEMIVNTDRRSWNSPTDIFIRPTVAEVVGAGFDRPSNSCLDTLRFPRVIKIHHDRTFADAVTLEEYQMMAEVSRNSCKQEVEENTNLWLRKLGFGHLVDDLDATTPSPQSTRASSSSCVTDSECDDLLDQQQLIPKQVGKRSASDVSPPAERMKRRRLGSE